jgi:hypothetical protein
MKITRAPTPFPPLVLTLETPAEVAAIIAAFGAPIVTQTNPALKEGYAQLVKTFGYPAVPGEMDGYTPFAAALDHLRDNKDAI